MIIKTKCIDLSEEELNLLRDVFAVSLEKIKKSKQTDDEYLYRAIGALQEKLCRRENFGLRPKKIITWTSGFKDHYFTGKFRSSLPCVTDNVRKSICFETEEQAQQFIKQHIKDPSRYCYYGFRIEDYDRERNLSDIWDKAPRDIWNGSWKNRK